MPAINIQVLAYRLYICHQVLRRIVYGLSSWQAATTSALIKQNDVVMRGVKKASLSWIAATAGAAM